MKLAMTAKGLLYTLLTIIIIITTFTNIFISVVDDRGALDIVVFSLIMALALLGLISLFLKAAARWRRVGGVLFLLMGLMGILALPSYYHDRGDSFTDYLFLLLPYLALVLSWAISGVLVWRGKAT